MDTIAPFKTKIKSTVKNFPWINDEMHTIKVECRKNRTQMKVHQIANSLSSNEKNH